MTGMLQMRMMVLIGMLLLAMAKPALAHAILVESTPAIGATIASGPEAMQLRFNSRIDRARSKLTLIRADKTTTPLSIAPEGSDDLLLTHLDLSAGTYSIRWQVLAIDGHITRGDVPFTVEAK